MTQPTPELQPAAAEPAFMTSTADEIHQAALLAGLIWNTPDLLELDFVNMTPEKVAALSRVIVVAASVGAAFEREQQTRSAPIRDMAEVADVFDFKLTNVRSAKEIEHTPIAPRLFADGARTADNVVEGVADYIVDVTLKLLDAFHEEEWGYTPEGDAVISEASIIEASVQSAVELTIKRLLAAQSTEKVVGSLALQRLSMKVRFFTSPENVQFIQDLIDADNVDKDLER